MGGGGKFDAFFNFFFFFEEIWDSGGGGIPQEIAGINTGSKNCKNYKEGRKKLFYFLIIYR